MQQRRAAIDEDGLVGADMARGMNAGLALGRGVAVGGGRDLVARVALDLRRRHDVAAEIGELVRVLGDVAAHRHLRHAEQLRRLAQMQHAPLRERADKGGDALGVAGTHRIRRPSEDQADSL